MNAQQADGFLNAYIFNPDLEPPADEPIFEGFLSKGDLAVWVGREKHRKSNVVLQCAICAVSGRDFLNFRFAAPAPLQVVLVDYESKRRMFSERYNAICRALNLTDQERGTVKANLRVVLVRELYRAGDHFPRFPVKASKDSKDEAERFWRRFAAEYPADLYVFDPMRCLHGEEENDSLIEALLSRLRQFFPNAATGIPHHMSKPESDHTVSLRDDMRRWSDRARGSTAIKASADLIVCQERLMEGETETVYLGAFMREGADIEPIPLVESDHESFYWKASASVPDHLRDSFEALRKANRPYREKKDAVEVIVAGASKSSKTGYRHVSELLQKGLLVRRDGVFVVSDAAETAAAPKLDSERI